MRRQSIFTLVIGVVLSTMAWAQESGTLIPEGLPQPAFINLGGSAEDYRVGPNDLLDIQVVGRGQLNQTLRVSNSGDISLPMAGIIPVADLTVFEVEAAIAARLRERELLRDPQVLVFVMEYQAKPIYISGAVVNPGEFIMSQDLTVMDAILLAGGLLPQAETYGYLHRRQSPEADGWPGAAVIENPATPRPGVEIIQVDLEPISEGRLLEATLPLKAGDVLVVPQRQLNTFFVVGEVLMPRDYSYAPGRTLMASQAISWTGGPTPTAKMSEGMLIRYDEAGERQELPVDYAAILRGDQPDFPIEANDVIFIPGSTIKTIAHGMLMLTDTMVMSASFRVARTYQMPDPPERNPGP